MISNDLQSAYEAGQESASQNPAPQAGDPSFAMTPQVKQMIANEVQSQIALENAEAQQNSQNQDPDPASSGIARMLGDEEGITCLWLAFRWTWWTAQERSAR